MSCNLMLCYSTAMADSFDDEEFDDNDGPAAEGEPLPVIGKATALYQFEGASATCYCHGELQ